MSVLFVMVVAAVALLRAELLADRATTGDLGGGERYLTHVSTDKPIYRPGEKVYVRGVILHANKHTPLAGGGQLQGVVEIKGPKGDVVASGFAVAEDSVVGFAWPVPAEQAGGEYTVKVSYPGYGHAPAQRRFDIRAYRAPRLKSQIVFLRDGYGPGDDVGATLHVERAEGGIPDGAEVTAIARVDGEEVFRGPARVDADGNCTVHFELPESIARGEGTLALVIEDGGIVETAAKTIPILLQTVDLNLYPEGGELVAGLATRVYLEARTPARKPADIAGVVLDAEGHEVAAFRTEHEGRGRFEFTPKKGGAYTLKINEPSGINTTYPLPAVKDAGTVIRALDDRYPRDEAVRLGVLSTAAGRRKITLSKREVEVASASFDAEPGVVANVVLTPPSSADGVLVATVWDESGKPLAERLIYREPDKTLKINVTADEKSYVPGAAVTLTVATTDENGSPLGAVVGLTVTDDSVLEMIEKREQAPRLPVMVLLEDDVQELADAHVYLDASDPKAPRAVDLLLGTQGWRRFAFIDAPAFLAKHGDAARRVLALRMTSPTERDTSARHAGKKRGLGRFEWFFGGEAGAPVPEAAAAPVDNFAVRAAGPKVPPAAKPVENEAERLRVDAKPARPALVAALDEAKKMEVAQAIAPFAERELADADVARLRRRAPARNDFVAVRVYAHASRPNRRPGDRVDFTETLLWNAGVRTDAMTGKATVSFALGDSITAFRVLADGFSERGALGAGTTTVESVEPFYLEPKLPLEVTAGDVVQLPLGIVSGVDTQLTNVALTTNAPDGISITGVEPFALDPKARERQILAMRIGQVTGPFFLEFAANAGPYADKVTRTLNVKPLGFPVEVAFGGMLGPDAPVAQAVVIPADVVPASLTTTAAVYPTPLANLTQALERLIREPHGCFEQTSSTTYPLVMAQQYFLSHTGVEPALIERSRSLLDKGYAKLVSFECKQKGYEWFAADPGHEALTAYGLLEFNDMSKVREVDADMLARTRAWLLKARDGKGGFTRKRRALHTWITDPDCSNGYVTWALLEAGEKSLAPEIASLRTAAAASKNSYVLALAANVMHLAGEEVAARKLMDRLVAKQTKDGWVNGATTSIVGSGGDALKIETTSLAVLAWLRDPSYAAAVENGIRYLAESCKSGRYGSTQSTVLALRAIVDYDKARAKPKAPGAVRILVDGQTVGDAVAFDAKTQGAIELPDISELLEPGKHTVELKMTDGSEMPFSLAVNYHNRQPASAEECSLDLEVSLRDERIDEGAVTEAAVVVTNKTDKPIPTPVAIVGLPGGLEPRHDQLKELVKTETIAAYEVIGRDVVLYWRELKANQKVELPLSVVAAVPGTYTAPASRAYLYYTDEHKTWRPGLQVTINARSK